MTVVPVHGAAVALHQPTPAAVAQYVVPPVDSWIQAFAEIVKLAEYIAPTAFVPDGLRGNPAAVAAAILAGREIGVDPMTALQSFDVIKGKPGMKPFLMRTLVLGAGHSITYPESSDTKVTAHGKRRDSGDTLTVTVTAQQLKNAGIALGGWPEDKLVARATGRLCRRLFADVIAGMPYTTDEAGDGSDELNGSAVDVAMSPPPRAAAILAAPATNPADDVPAQILAAIAAADSPVHLNDIAGAITDAERSGAVDEETAGTLRDAMYLRAGQLPAGKKALTRMHAALGELQLTADRAEKLLAVSNVVGRTVGSTSELTGAEADLVWRKASEAVEDGGRMALLHSTEPPADVVDPDDFADERTPDEIAASA